MKQDPIREAFHTATPTADQRARMRAALEAKLPKETNDRGRYQQRQTPPRRFSWVPAVAVLFLVVIIGGFVLGGLYGGTGTMSPSQTAAPQTKYNALPEFYTSPLYQAIIAWQEYLASYSADASESVPYPYSSFGCVNGQMQSALDALCEKYGLTLQSDDSGGTDSMDYLLEVLGLKSIFKSLPEVESGLVYGAGGWIYPDGSVEMGLSTTMSDTGTVVYKLYTIPKNSLFSCLLPLGAVEEYASWDYTTQDGITLLLARKEDDAFLFTAGQENVVYVDISYFQQDGTIRAITKEAMEAFAETIDFAALIGMEIPQETTVWEDFFASDQFQASKEYIDFCNTLPVRLTSAEREEQLVEKQQALAEQYALKTPTGTSGLVPEEIFETLGVRNPVRTMESVSAELKSGTRYADGGFTFRGVTQMTALDSPWRTRIEYTFYFLQKGSLYPYLAEDLSEEVTEAWEYTTENGVPLVLFRGTGSACLLSEREDAYVLVWISNPDLEYTPLKGEQTMGEEALIAFAETFDFSVLIGADNGGDGAVTQKLLESTQYQATLEWQDNLKSSQKWSAIREWFTGSSQTLPWPYPDYGCTSESMIEKLDELCRTYGLTLVSDYVAINDYAELMDIVGVTEICRQDVTWEFDSYGSGYSSDGSFDFSGCTSFAVEFTFYRIMKDTFHSALLEIGDISQYETWEYAASDGTVVLLARDADKGLILLPREKDLLLVTAVTPEGETAPESEVLEALADGFHYALPPDGGLAPIPEPKAVAREQLDVYSVPSPNATVVSQIPAGTELMLRKRELVSGKPWAYVDDGWIDLEKVDLTYGETEYDPSLYVYDAVLEKYVTAICEGWDGAQCSEADISILVRDVNSLDSLGYALMDLDGNGNQELIVTDGNVIYDLYTLLDDGPGHLLMGSERNAYFLCEGNVLKNTGSNSAASSFTAFFKLDGIDFRYQETVSFSADIDPENPWFLASNFSDALTPITEEEANAVMDSYTVLPIETRPLTEKP